MAVTFSYLLDPGYPVFTLGEQLSAVAHKLADEGLGCAPVFDGERYVGLVFLANILQGRKGWPAAREKLDMAMIEPVRAHLAEEQLFENLHSISTSRSGIVPVVDADGRYAGVVMKQKILAFLADRIHAGEGGSTMEIEVPPTGARLSEIIDMIEKNDATILSLTSWPSGIAGEGQIIFFRVASRDFFRLVRNMENYGYIIRYHSAFPDADYDDLREKAIEFIRYIDM